MSEILANEVDFDPHDSDLDDAHAAVRNVGRNNNRIYIDYYNVLWLCKLSFWAKHAHSDVSKIWNCNNEGEKIKKACFRQRKNRYIIFSKVREITGDRRSTA